MVESRLPCSVLRAANSCPARADFAVPVVSRWTSMRLRRSLAISPLVPLGRVRLSPRLRHGSTHQLHALYRNALRAARWLQLHLCPAPMRLAAAGLRQVKSSRSGIALWRLPDAEAWGKCI